MHNTITITALAANTTKAIEYMHPNTGVWQDSNVLLNVTPGVYSNILCRLKGSNPIIQAVWARPVTVTNGTTTAPGDTSPPAITLTVPAAGAVLVAGSQVTLTATATDNVAVAGVAFTNGATGAPIGSAAKNGTTYTLPYTVPNTPGPLTLTATATDAAGNSQPATVNVTVQAATNQLPTANAGNDVTLQLPNQSSVALMGTGSDADGTVSGYAWRPVAGPNTPTGLPATTQNVVVSGLIAGTYQFGFKTQDNAGAWSAEDFVMVTVQAALVQSTGETDGPALPAGTPVGVTTVLTTGDSLTAGYIANGSFVGPTDPATGNSTTLTTAYYLQQALGTAAFRSFHNAGHSGATSATILNEAHANVDANVDRSQDVRAVVCSQMGANDGGMSVTDWFALVKQGVADRKFYGVESILITNSPCSSNAATTAKANYLRAHFSETGAYALCDLAADARIQDPTNPTYYQSDGLHYQAKMNLLVANLLAPLIKQFALNYTRPAGSALATEAAEWANVSGTTSVSGTTATAGTDNATLRSTRRAVETTQSPYLSAKFTIASTGARSFFGVANAETNELLYSFYQNGGQVTPYRGSGLEASGAGFRSVGVGSACELQLGSTGVCWVIAGEKVIADYPLFGGRYHLVFQALNGGATLKDCTLTGGLFEGTLSGGGGGGTVTPPPAASSLEAVGWANDANTSTTAGSGTVLATSGTNGDWNAGAHSSRVFPQLTSDGSTYVEWPLSNAGGVYMLGWNLPGAAVHYGGIRHGLYIHAGVAEPFSNSGSLGGGQAYEVGQKARITLYPGKVVYSVNGVAFFTETVATETGLRVAISLKGPGATAKNVVLSGTNLTGTSGGAPPTAETVAFTTENAAWAGQAAGNTLAVSGNGGVIYTTRNFPEYAMLATGLRASMRWKIKAGSGRYLAGFNVDDASPGFTFYMNGGSISPYRGSPYAASNDAMVGIADGEEMRVDVYNDRVEWVKNGVTVYTNPSRVTTILKPSIQFLDGGGEIDLVILSGLGLAG